MSFSLSWIAMLVILLVSLLLEYLPMPQLVLFLRPEWIVLAMVYFLLRAPDKVGLVSAALLGLIVDVIRGSPFGIHAAAMSIVAYLILSMYDRFKLFPILQQSFIMFFVLGIYAMLTHAFQGLLGQPSGDFSFLWMSCTSAIVWPLVIIFYDRIGLSLR